MLGPSDILIDDVARDASFAISAGNLVCKVLAGQKAAALGESQSPARRHDRFSCESDVLGHDLLVVLSEDEVIYHLTVRCFEAVVITALGSELELSLVCVVKEDTIAVAAHEERNALVQRVFHGAVAWLVAVPHLVGLSSSVELSCLFA